MQTARFGTMLWKNALNLMRRYRVQRGMVFGAIIFCALLAFEMFNYTTTDFALTDLLGPIRFASVKWATILSIAFCGMDFAGIARLFTPEKGRGERLEVWYLLGAWFLAATMNAMLTWWGVSIALLNHTSLGNEILGRQQLLSIVPVFVALLVWLIRILMIGTFSLAGDRMFSQAEESLRRAENEWSRQSARPAPAAAPKYTSPVAARPAARTIGEELDDEYDQRPHSTYEQNRTYARPVAPMRPTPAPMPAVRPAPKPAPVGFAGAPNSNTAYRAAPARTDGRNTSGMDRN